MVRLVAASWPVFYFVNAVSILVCGIAGAYAAWVFVDALGWTDAGGAVVAAMIGMVAATLLWTGGVALGKVLRRLK